jgi:ABC-type multidrug transport system fused ATPase/permease subunit
MDTTVGREAKVTIVQRGTYDELMARDGLFRRLATRQMA